VNVQTPVGQRQGVRGSGNEPRETVADPGYDLPVDRAGDPDRIIRRNEAEVVVVFPDWRGAWIRKYSSSSSHIRASGSRSAAGSM
jgi:hypothetical protein